MRYILTLLLTVSTVGSELFAQQIPLYSQYYFNKFIYNPAFAGDQEKTEAYLVGRRQWDGVSGYETNVLTVNGIPGNTNVGLGLHVINDKNAIVNSNSVYGSYAYRLKMGDNSMLAMGMALGMWDTRFNMDNVVVTDPNDPLLPLLNQKGGPVIDANFGINLKAGGFQLGLSLPQAFAGKQAYKDNYNRVVNYDLVPHFTGTVSFDIWLSPEKVKLQPLVMYKSVKNAPAQFDGNLMLDWIGKGWLSAGYRDEYAVTFSGGLKVASILRIGYSYDYSIHEQSAALGATHELLIGVSLDKSDRYKKDENAEKAERARKAREAALDSMRDERMNSIQDEIETMKKEGGIKDTVVIVKKVETIVKQAEEKPTEVKDTKPAQSASGVSESGKFMVVAGSFTEQKYAKGYVARLKNLGQPAAIHQASNGTYYVHIGRFDDKAEARKLIKNNKNAQLTLWIKTLE